MHLKTTSSFCFEQVHVWLNLAAGCISGSSFEHSLGLMIWICFSAHLALSHWSEHHCQLMWASWDSFWRLCSSVLFYLFANLHAPCRPEKCTETQCIPTCRMHTSTKAGGFRNILPSFTNWKRVQLWKTSCIVQVPTDNFSSPNDYRPIPFTFWNSFISSLPKGAHADSTSSRAQCHFQRSCSLISLLPLTTSHLLTPQADASTSTSCVYDGNEQCSGTAEVEPPAAGHLEDEGDLSSARKRICRCSTLGSFTLGGKGGTAAKKPNLVFLFLFEESRPLGDFACVGIISTTCLFLHDVLQRATGDFLSYVTRFDNDGKCSSPSRIYWQRNCVWKTYIEHNLRVLRLPRQMTSRSELWCCKIQER